MVENFKVVPIVHLDQKDQILEYKNNKKGITVIENNAGFLESLYNQYGNIFITKINDEITIITE